MIRALKRFRRSRGWRKFRKNKPANVALAVIAVYALVAAWIIGVETADSIGEGTGAFRVADHPVFGALVADATAAEVGPPHLPGLGFTPDRDARDQRAAQLLERARRAIDAAGRAESDESLQRVYAEAALGHLKLAALAPDQLESIVAEAGPLADQLSSLATQNTLLAKISLAATRLESLARDLASATPQTEPTREDILDELSLTLEDVVFSAQDYADLAPSDDPVSRLDLAALEDAAMDLADLPTPEQTPDPLYDRALIDQLRLDRPNSPAALAAERIQRDRTTTLDNLEPVVTRLYPKPTGYDALAYNTQTLFGTDRQGRSIFVRAVYSAKVAVQVGVVTAILCVLIGALLGSAAAYFGGWVDHAVIWLYSTFSSIPSLVLLVVLAFIFTGKTLELFDLSIQLDQTLIPLYTAFAMTYWIGPCRVIRGEVLKIKELEYVQAATIVGFPRIYILLKHVIPNTLHLVFINFSLLFIAAVKGEVILTFLGLGLKDGASWGIMISQSKGEVVNGDFWQIGTATMFMFVLVLAFNILTDALQDAFDPRHVG